MAGVSGEGECVFITVLLCLTDLGPLRPTDSLPLSFSQPSLSC